jgi:hypothetical protein
VSGPELPFELIRSLSEEGGRMAKKEGNPNFFAGSLRIPLLTQVNVRIIGEDF